MRSDRAIFCGRQMRIPLLESRLNRSHNVMCYQLWLRSMDDVDLMGPEVSLMMKVLVCCELE